jgi:hypothetical protein
VRSSSQPSSAAVTTTSQTGSVTGPEPLIVAS